MADEDSDAREQALRFAAGLHGLALVRTGDTYALGPGGYLMPVKKGQKPPDLSYFNQTQK